MEFKWLVRDELSQLKDIDRKEFVGEVYYVRNQMLQLVKEYYDIEGWLESELTIYVQRLESLFDRDGIIIGAYEEGILVGLVSLESYLIDGKTMKLDMLYVSHDYRGKGLGRRLIDIISQEATELGAKELYISATPVRNTVDFYLRLGAELANPPDIYLFELEPLDIHLILPI
ncbi:GNAT family N-acetyltransferase [Listeria newyorkensis]|uniref:GNAT family N-acetyltransferase n=1 Tax=Listeria newyorkensis TaxID=1497681 RepID=A0ABX4XM26_9LIST|nr:MULTISPECIES: GNAT family N-acetyltransferase [Listeria]KGL44853.1 GNAT family acetyltransferase [Listeriaceae bacterium FSL A5-0209]KGL41022.1 GNAT family acetyltransferase [Listeria newyorkensis]KMT57798.1 GNAT family acetyltransferase [Listeria newyorkensis]PNP92498.1 GNAT family N-acetyltransferase [Listeria newyorkensis]RQW68434.1 GNAT family N-acetyltransferase [Listeria sp. SHR_NRA_18]